ncbi:MAG TPA: hypothetical protein VJ989_07295 [Solirubrobacterales bacterium]|nr:hypothetical protein [Solirubrobacterales bacterium]
MSRVREKAARSLAWVASYLDILTLAFGAAAAVLAVAHSAGFPKASTWSAGHALPPIQIAAVAAWVTGQVCLAIQGRRRRRNRKLEDACRNVAAFVDEKCPSLPLAEVGVHIWQVPLVKRQLRRAGSFLLIGDRARSGIPWTKGKGVVGEAWRLKTHLTKNLEEIRARANTREAFEALPIDDRLGLSWSEVQRTPGYKAVYARPLYSREGQDHDIKGILAIDILGDGHYGALVRATEDEGFLGVIGTCETALSS